MFEAGLSAVEVARKLNRPLESVRSRKHRLARSAPRNLTDAGAKAQPTHELDPTPELPDDTPVDRLRLPTRIKNVLAAEGVKTVGEVRETLDEMLLAFPDLGYGSVAHLRETLGLSSKDGVRPPLAAGLKAKK
jgi:DNA-directed RNA polymerase alpha subunit